MVMCDFVEDEDFCLIALPNDLLMVFYYFF